MNQIFVIHGWTYSLDKWTDINKVLEKRGVKVNLLRVPGLTEPSDKVWDIEGYIKWLDGKLQGVTKPVVVGHSNGGRIALAYSQKYPNKLGKLILIDSAGVAHNDFIPRTKLKILRVISKIGKVFSYIPMVKKVFYKLIGAQDYLNAPPNMKKTMGNMLRADQTINLSSITVPTTIIWGKQDAITPLKDGLKIESSVKGSKLFVIDDARHGPFINHPDEVADIIVNTLKGDK
jgi:pimeloyl-ACP methyl ester carboxylesterase